MKGRALIDTLRETRGPVSLLREEFALLADAVEEADDSTRTTVESCCPRADDWWDTSAAYPGDTQQIVEWSLSYLDRRGLIERKEGEPHLVRFVEEA